ncbi:MAG: GNAT family N-acetyltransferase [Muribaculaceae bacterium]|nr:GNAT family N-acetyltransferase [Muribaculaceae bacterium]
MDWEFRPYDPQEHRAQWDDFNLCSRNGSFLFDRNYMDYHSDRFADASLIALHKGKVTALLPADITCDGVLRSHGGLTYGGWILPQAHTDGSDILDMMTAWTDLCRAKGYRAIDYRPAPYIYHRRPSQEDIYALRRLGFAWTGSLLSSAIDYADPGCMNTLQRRHLRKASALNPVIGECGDVLEFHRMLSDCLSERHQAAPVHSGAELRMLAGRFPENIRIFTASADGVAHAGVCLYISATTAHCQYIATTPYGRRTNLLTPLMDELIRQFSRTHRYFDFGTSNEEGGAVLNAGLIRQKFSYGATGVACDRYYLEL